MRWLLGDDAAPRFIPAGIAAGPAFGLSHDDHHPLAELDSEHILDADDHPHALPGHHNVKLHYPHDPNHDRHEIVVSGHRELVEHYVENSHIWVRATPEGETDPTRAIDLLQLIEAVAARIAGHGDIEQALASHADEVHDLATKDLARRLHRLVDTGVITAEDREYLDPGSLVAAMIDRLRSRERIEDVDHHADFVVTTVVTPPGDHEIHYSVRFEALG